MNWLTSTSEQGARFKSLGKAALKGTKQIGKTLTAISDSPDRRAQGRLAQVQASQFTQRHKRKQWNQTPVLASDSLGLDGGKLLAPSDELKLPFSQNNLHRGQ